MATGAGVGHEVVVDEVHRVGSGVEVEHPSGEGPLQPERVGAVPQRPEAGPQARQLGDASQAHRDAGVASEEVLDVLDGVDAEGKADRGAYQHARSSYRRAGPSTIGPKIDSSPTPNRYGYKP